MNKNKNTKNAIKEKYKVVKKKVKNSPKKFSIKVKG
jgi:hypothetical protein